MTNPRLEQRLKVIDSDVAAEVMDGEAIIINLATGVYYSMDGAGASLWSMVQQGYTLETVAEALGTRFGVQPERVEADVVSVAAKLLDEGLVVVEEADGSEESSPPVLEPTEADYRPPVLEVYRDMEQLLALDPPMPGLKDTGWEEDEGVQAPGEE